VRDSINYFPGEANQPCRMLFFTDPVDQRAMAFDEFELSWQRGCVGRLFFKLPEGTTIEPGQYWLVVSFAGSSSNIFTAIVRRLVMLAEIHWDGFSTSRDSQ
jgi:hypothetical protein